MKTWRRGDPAMGIWGPGEYSERANEEQMQRLEAGACPTCSGDREEAAVAPGGGNGRDKLSR